MSHGVTGFLGYNFNVIIGSYQLLVCFKLNLNFFAKGQLNTPGLANQGPTRHTRNIHAGILRQVGAKLCGPPGPILDYLKR